VHSLSRLYIQSCFSAFYCSADPNGFCILELYDPNGTKVMGKLRSSHTKLFTILSLLYRLPHMVHYYVNIPYIGDMGTLQCVFLKRFKICKTHCCTMYWFDECAIVHGLYRFEG
jgi:hypothetical protein